VSDLKLGDLYAGLTDTERARLLARHWRAGDGPELARLRRSIPDQRARRAYDEALTLLRGLNGAFFLGGVMLAKVGFERDVFAAEVLCGPERQRALARLWLWDLWTLVAYPVTEAEYRMLAELERAEPIDVDDYAETLWGMTTPDEGARLRAELGAINGSYREEMGESEQERLWDAFRACFAGAIERGELPRPVCKGNDGGRYLPRGLLSDWAEGTTAETYRPAGPGFAIPALELFTSPGMDYEILPDAEADRVQARRARLREALLPIGWMHLGIPREQLEMLSFDPPRNIHERNEARHAVERIWPRSDDARAGLRAVAAQFAGKRAEFRVITDVLEMVQREVFGGEDPLDPDVRALVEQTQETARWAEELWAVFLDDLAPHDDGEPWPPALDDGGYYDELRPRYEERLRAGV